MTKRCIPEDIYEVIGLSQGHKVDCPGELWNAPNITSPTRKTMMQRHSIEFPYMDVRYLQPRRRKRTCVPEAGSFTKRNMRKQTHSCDAGE